jgi:outer membrane autotransporter protein
MLKHGHINEGKAMNLRKTILAAAITMASSGFAMAETVVLNNSPISLQPSYDEGLTFTGVQTGDLDPAIIDNVVVNGHLTFGANITANGEGSTGLQINQATIGNRDIGDENPYEADIINNGTVTANGTESTGMAVGNSKANSLLNDGRIVGVGAESRGLHLLGTNLTGVLQNDGTISGGSRGIDIDSNDEQYTDANGNVVGSGAQNTTLRNIDNSGKILATELNGRAILIDGATFYESNKGLVNTGTIAGGAVGIDFGRFQMEADPTNYDPDAGFDKTHFQILAEKGEISGGEYAIKGGDQRVDLTLGNNEGRGTATIRGNLDGLALTNVVGPAQFFGTNIQSQEVRINSGATLTLNNPHTTIDGDLNVRSGGALGLPLSAETLTSQPVLKVTGAANLASGSSVVINAKGSDFAKGGVNYDLINAGSLSVASDVAIQSSSALLTVSNMVAADGKLNVKVTAVGGDDAGGVVGDGGGNANDQAATKSFMSVATVLANTSPNDPVLKALLAAGNDKDAIATIAKKLSPDVNGGASSAAFSSQAMVNNAIGARNEEMRKGQSSGDVLVGTGGWFQILSSNANQDVRSGIEGYDADSNGFAIGADGKLNENTTVGLAYSYIKTDVKSDGGNKTDVENNNLTAYGSWTEGNYFVDGALTYGKGKNDSKRYIAGTTAKGDYDSDMVGLGLTAGYGFQFDRIVVEPRVAARYSNLNIDGFTEKGSSAALTTGDQRLEIGEIGAGVRVAGAFDVARGTLEPEVKLMAYHDVIGDKSNTTSAFVLGGNTFVANGASPARDSYQVGVGAKYKLDAVTFGIGYDRLTKTGFDADTFTAKVRYDF